MSDYSLSAQSPTSCQLEQPSGDYTMYFDTSEAGQSGSTIQIRCMLDNPGGDLYGWSYAVCEETVNNDYDITGAVSGAATLSANGGSPPSFEEIIVCPDEGVIHGVVVDYIKVNTLPAGTGHEMLVVDVFLHGPDETIAPVDYCTSNLCSIFGPYETIVVPPGGSAVLIPQQLTGWIMMGDFVSIDCNSNGILDGCEIDQGAEDFNANGILDECEELFIRGDVDGDGAINVADAVIALAYLFTGGSINCAKAADSNADGILNIADGIQIIGYLFSASGDIAAPFPDCGLDPSANVLDCDNFEGCP